MLTEKGLREMVWRSVIVPAILLPRKILDGRTEEAMELIEETRKGLDELERLAREVSGAKA